MKEEWRVIEKFQDYSVSNQGRVVSGYSDRILAQSMNQQHIQSVGMVGDDRRQYRRSVAFLVASAFLHKPHYKYDTPTPINLNGDRTDNRVENLKWRPRWFAIKYHQQFSREPYKFTKRIVLTNTDEVFNDAREPSVLYGLLEVDIVRDLTNQRGVWPEGFIFDYVDE